MSAEADFIAHLRRFATDPAARGLIDDAAVLPVAAGDLVLTHDMIVEGVHFLADSDPVFLAWKLIAVNVSDLAAKGARPIGALLGFSLGDDQWDRRFAQGLEAALGAFSLDLLGGDTVRLPPGAPRILGLTAIGQAPACGAPSRSGAQAGDRLWVTGTIGDAGAGLQLCRADAAEPRALTEAYLRPKPRLDEGIALAPQVSAMMDVSDGLLIDAQRMAAASELMVRIDLAAIPLSVDYIGFAGDTCDSRLAAATAGDDYELLFALPKDATPHVAATCIGAFAGGEGIALVDGEAAIALPDRLGFLH